jgi:hypothetical protein
MGGAMTEVSVEVAVAMAVEVEVVRLPDTLLGQYNSKVSVDQFLFVTRYPELRWLPEQVHCACVAMALVNLEGHKSYPNNWDQNTFDI